MPHVYQILTMSVLRYKVLDAKLDTGTKYGTETQYSRDETFVEKKNSAHLSNSDSYKCKFVLNFKVITVLNDCPHNTAYFTIL